jgi:hypothetical protein
MHKRYFELYEWFSLTNSAVPHAVPLHRLLLNCSYFELAGSVCVG